MEAKLSMPEPPKPSIMRYAVKHCTEHILNSYAVHARKRLADLWRFVARY